MEGRDLTMLDVDLAMLNLVFVKFNLLGGFNPSEKYESVGIIFPTEWKVIKKNMVPVTTKQLYWYSNY